MKSEALEATEVECAEGRTAPRVSLTDIENYIVREIYVNGENLAKEFDQHTSRHGPLDPEISSMSVLTLCILILKNGFTIVGKSAPASEGNFDANLGAKLAYEDAVRQIWPLMGFALRDRLHRGGE
jgi:Phage protein (N4 Gp49/phage Sf6 gene 66) family